MIIRRIIELGISQPRLLEPVVIVLFFKSHRADRCPGYGSRPVCAPQPSVTQGGSTTRLVRAVRSGKCRLGFLPEEWFTFFKNITGVSGPYLLMIGLANYCLSKEIYVMEHEYYSGLSILLLMYLISTRLGPTIGSALDKEVDAVHESYQKGRNDEMNTYQTIVKEAMLAQARAKGQSELMTAKKENIALQLEAVYRERLMHVYNTVKNRMEYQVRRATAERNIQQKWLVQWVMKRINEEVTTSEFQKRSLKDAIYELGSIAEKCHLKKK